jgi:putative peptidoglycan lipid II flippase
MVTACRPLSYTVAMETTRMSLARDVTTMGGATLASRLLGFTRDAGIAAMLGAGVFSDAFFAVLQITNFFRRLLTEGAINAAFVPSWLRIERTQGKGGADRFFKQVLGVVLLAVVVLAVIGIVLAGPIIALLAPGFDGERNALAATCLRIAAPYIALAGVVAVLAAALNAQRRVVAVALGAVAFNAVLLLVLAWIAAIDVAPPAAVAALLAQAIVLAGLAQLLVIGAGFLRWRPQTRSLKGSVRGARPASGRPGLSADVARFFALAGPGLVAAGIPQLKLIAGAMVASSSQAAVSWLYYANRLYELPLGVVAISIASVLVPNIAARVRGNDPAAIAAMQSRGLEIALGVALPAAVAFAVLAEPIAGGLFERGAFGPRDTAAVGAALTAICIGLPGHTLEKVFGAVSFAHEDTRTPMLAALAGLAVAVLGSLALFPHYGHVGVAAAIGVSGWVGATLLGAILRRRGWLRFDRDMARRLPRIILATTVMGLAIFALHRLLGAHVEPGEPLARLITLGLLVASGLATYLASLEMLGIARLRDLLAAIRRR